MKGLWPGERFTRMFERAVLSVVQVLLMILIALGLVDLGFLLWHGITHGLFAIVSVGQLQQAMQRGFAGILLLLIGLELLETVRAYLADHRVRLEVVLIVAIIAVGRHLIMLDLERMDGLTLIGISALMLAVTAGYFLIRRNLPIHHRKSELPDSHPRPEES